MTTVELHPAPHRPSDLLARVCTRTFATVIAVAVAGAPVLVHAAQPAAAEPAPAQPAPVDSAAANGWDELDPAAPAAPATATAPVAPSPATAPASPATAPASPTPTPAPKPGFGANEIIMVVGGVLAVVGIGLAIGAGVAARRSSKLRDGIEDGSSDDVAADLDEGNKLDRRALGFGLSGGSLFGVGLGLVLGGAGLRKQARQTTMAVGPGGLEVRF